MLFVPVVVAGALTSVPVPVVVAGTWTSVPVPVVVVGAWTSEIDCTVCVQI